MTIDAACAHPPSPELRRAVQQFNQGDYYACHETLENLWIAESRPVRRLYQGILQIGIALHHLQRGNEAGALSLLKRGPSLLRPFSPVCQDLDVAALIEDAHRAEGILQSGGLRRAQQLGRGFFPRIRWVGEMG